MSDRERVLFLLESFGAGGAEIATANLVQGLIEGGHRCDVASLMPPDTLADRFSETGATVHRLGIRHRWRADQALRRLTSLIRRTKPTVLHGQLFFAGLYSAATRLGTRDVRRVVTYQNLGYDSYPPHGPWLRLRRQLDGMAMRRGVDAHVAVSNAVADHYRRHLGVRFDEVIPNAIDARSLAAAPAPARSKVLGALGLPDQPLMVCPARFVHEKGHRFLIEALADPGFSAPDAVLVLAGEGPLRPEIEAQVRSAALGERVRFLGALPNSELIDILRVSDVVVLPSTHEGFPVVIAESAAVGSAIVATSVGGIPEFIEDGVSGVLVPPGSPSALREAVGSLLSNQSRKQILGPNAQARALAMCDAQVVAKRYEQVYGGSTLRSR